MKDTTATVMLQDAFWLTAEDLMYHHTNPWELDEALFAQGYGMGPCEAQDLLGLEKVLARRPDRPVPILPRMVAEGRMGKGGGVGYYRYPGGGGAVIDPLVEDLILEEAWFGKIKRSEMSDSALVERMHAAFQPIVSTLLDQGMKEQDIVTILHQALHFPEGGDLTATGLSRK
jgi:3-hydroxyacyl-CoA dehydrogenase